MSRAYCFDCVRKHIAQASILMDESKLGYPHHRWYAIGHLAEAESESRKESMELAKEIRTCRLGIMKESKDCIEPDFDQLILKVCKMAGDNDDLKLDKRNSKNMRKLI